MYESYKTLSCSTVEQINRTSYANGIMDTGKTTSTSTNIFGLACHFNNITIKGSLVSPCCFQNEKLN